MYHCEVCDRDTDVSCCNCPNYNPGKELNDETRLTIMMDVAGHHPAIYNQVGNILYKFFGFPMVNTVTLLITYVVVKLKEQEE